MRANLLTLAAAFTTALAGNVSVAIVNRTSTYLLPEPFSYSPNSSFAGAIAGSSAYATSYSTEFTNLLANANVTVIKVPLGGALETGVWVPSHNQVWYTSSITVAPTYYRILDLDNNTIIDPQPRLSQRIVNPNGGFYLNGTIYAAVAGGNQTAPSLLTINPSTFEVTTLVNSYFGLRFPSLDDVVATCSGLTYFSSVDFSAFGGPNADHTGNQVPQLANAFWLFDRSSGRLQPVITKDEIQTPNGVGIDKGNTVLYATDTTVDWKDSAIGTPTIWRYSIGAHGQLYNRTLFGYAREGIPDGIKVDDSGRVWTGEGEGVVVRDSLGAVLGVFNVGAIRALVNSTDTAPIANFAFADNKFIILAGDSVQIVELEQTIVAADRWTC